MGTIVHDTLVIIAYAVIGDSTIVILFEIMLFTCKSSLKFGSRILCEIIMEYVILRILWNMSLF